MIFNHFKKNISSFVKHAGLAAVISFSSFNAMAEMNKQSMIEAYESGTYFHEIDLEVEKAKNYLTQWAKKTKKPAIVLDIDETSLSNYSAIKEAEFPQDYSTLLNTVAHSKKISPAIASTKSLYDLALKKNVTVFFVTGRPATKENIKNTEKRLKKAGYTGYKKIYFRPVSDKQKSVTNYKLMAHQDITEKGYAILVNMGDQQSDLVGNYAQLQVKLPNPFYKLH